MTVMSHDAGYEIKRKSSDLWLGNKRKIHTILVPTVPIIENNIGIADLPMPRSALGKRSIIEHRKYVADVMAKISKPYSITEESLV